MYRDAFAVMFEHMCMLLFAVPGEMLDHEVYAAGGATDFYEHDLIAGVCTAEEQFSVDFQQVSYGRSPEDVLHAAGWLEQGFLGNLFAPGERSCPETTPCDC